jgi:hypothetical protein
MCTWLVTRLRMEYPRRRSSLCSKEGDLRQLRAREQAESHHVYKGRSVELTLVASRIKDHRSLLVAVCAIAHLAAAAIPAAAQSPPATTEATPAASIVQEDDDAVLKLAEPDFVVVNLPTTLRLPRFKGNFRLTHRFAGNLRNGTLGQQASNLFGVDQGAIIGFEYRFGVAPHVQAAFYRSSFDKTIQLHGKYDVAQQRESMPVSISPLVSIEGADNFQEKYAPAAGVVVSRQVGTRLAGYVTPMWVHNSAPSLGAITHDHSGAAHSDSSDATPSAVNTTYLGLGGRVRLGSSTYVAAEIALRVQGYSPDQSGYGVSIEKRVGAHMFSLTFTNTFATTFAQLARGGAANSLFLGFNLGRKFF